MKYFHLFFFLILVQFSFGQDTLYFKSGEIRAVKIIEFDEHTNLMGYVYEEDTTYASIASFKNVVYSGNSSNQGGYSEIAKHQDSEEAREAVIQKIKLNPKYIYGKWAISTNLLGVFTTNGLLSYATNQVYSVEPEYFILDNLSLKMPIHFGLPKTESLYYYSSPYRTNQDGGGTEMLPYISSVSEYGRQQMGHKRDLLFQIGLNPKFYFRGQRTFGWYFGQGVYLSQINLNRVDYYYTYEKYFSGSNTFWTGPEISYESFDEKRIVFRYEGAIGLSINVLKGFGITSEIGYTTIIKSKNEGFDRVFIREKGEEYQQDPYLNQHAPNYNSGQSLMPYFRLHLVYRFGGVKNEFK